MEIVTHLHLPKDSTDYDAHHKILHDSKNWSFTCRPDGGDPYIILREINID